MVKCSPFSKSLMKNVPAIAIKPIFLSQLCQFKTSIPRFFKDVETKGGLWVKKWDNGSKKQFLDFIFSQHPTFFICFHVLPSKIKASIIILIIKQKPLSAWWPQITLERVSPYCGGIWYIIFWCQCTVLPYVVSLKKRAQEIIDYFSPTIILRHLKTASFSRSVCYNRCGRVVNLTLLIFD